MNGKCVYCCRDYMVSHYPDCWVRDSYQAIETIRTGNSDDEDFYESEEREIEPELYYTGIANMEKRGIM